MSGKTTFSTTSGHYEYCLMPYGLSYAPSVFQCLINDILLDMLGKYTIAYSDDILIFSPSPETCVDHVLACLLQNQQFVKGEKCEFHKNKISFLG